MKLVLLTIGYLAAMQVIQTCEYYAVDPNSFKFMRDTSDKNRLKIYFHVETYFKYDSRNPKYSIRVTAIDKYENGKILNDPVKDKKDQNVSPKKKEFSDPIVESNIPYKIIELKITGDVIRKNEAGEIVSI